MGAVTRLTSEELTTSDAEVLRALFEAAWEDKSGTFGDEDWNHALGGMHFLLRDGGDILSHASVVERRLRTGAHDLVTGYVEAVASRPQHQRRGHGTIVMRAVGDHIRAKYDLGALSTGSVRFYERLGWRPWTGPTFVRVEDRRVRTEEDDGSVLVLLTPTSPKLDLSAGVSCEWRPGDVW
ncbi:MAG: GNAT family N-acetyltransferase [Actinomycetota bacterium]